MGLPDQVLVPYSKGYDFGIGINFSTAGPKNKAVMGAISAVEGAPGDIVRFRIHRVNTTHELEQSLGISVEASYGAAAFGAGASARFDFAQSAKIQSSSLTMCITAKIERAFQQIDEPTLTGPASAVADNSTVFAERFGDMFVRGVTSGGMYIGYIRIDTGSSVLSDSISAELSGSYGLFSAKAKFKFEQVQKDYRGELAIDMYHEGGPADLRIENLDDPLELLRNVNLFLQSFADRPNEVAVPYQVTFAPLAIAEGPLPPNEIDLLNAQDVLIFCANRRSVLTDQMNTYQRITDHPDRFDFSNGADAEAIATAAEATQSDLDLIRKCASNAMNSPKEAALPEPFAKSKHIEYPQTEVPKILPTPVPIQPRTKPNSMPDLVGKPADPVTALLACVNLEDVDHCLGFTRAELILGDEARPLGEFFHLVTRAGTKFTIHGNAEAPGATIKAQIPPAGTEVTPSAVITLEC